MKSMKTGNYDPGAAVSVLCKLDKMFSCEGNIFSSSPGPGDRTDVLEKMMRTS